MTRHHFFPLLASGILLLVPTSEARPPDLPSWNNTPEEERILSRALWPAIDPPLTGEGHPAAPIVERAASPLLPEPEPEPFDLTSYRVPSADSLLYDPQHLLSEPRAVDLLSFLRFHARESAAPIHVVLFDGNDRPDGHLDLRAFADAWTATPGPSRPTLVLAYFLGYPERARIILPTHCLQLRRIADDEVMATGCIRAALVAQNPIDQLDRFGVELSIRVFALIRQLDSLHHPKIVPPELPEARLGPASLPWWSRWGFWKGAILFLSLAVPSAIAVWIIRAGRQDPDLGTYFLAEGERPLRLGGQHSGGTGCMIRFD